MIKVGKPPYLECSTKGDTRFSPFYARPSCLDGLSIEEAYHAFKLFDDGSRGFTWRRAKAKKKSGSLVVNQDACNELYSMLWDEYMLENDHLVEVLLKQTGLSDIFGYEPGPCQALELWRIRERELLKRSTTICDNVSEEGDKNV